MKRDLNKRRKKIVKKRRETAKVTTSISFVPRKSRSFLLSIPV
jgi:hypothetical protein